MFVLLLSLSLIKHRLRISLVVDYCCMYLGNQWFCVSTLHPQRPLLSLLPPLLTEGISLHILAPFPSGGTLCLLPSCYDRSIYYDSLGWSLNCPVYLEPLMDLLSFLSLVSVAANLCLKCMVVLEWEFLPLSQSEQMYAWYWYRV